MAQPRLWLSVLFGLLVVTGCPRRFDPRASEIHASPEAEADYRSATHKWQEGDLVGAHEAFKLFLEKYAGVNAAEPLLPLARYTLGLIEYRRGEFAEAQRLLSPFSAEIVEGDDAAELHAALADMYRRSEKYGDALREYELFYRSSHVRALEQAYIRTQVSAFLPQLSPAEQRSARGQFGLEPAAPTNVTAGGSRVVVGLVVPLAGKDRALGERVLGGALWAAQTLRAAHSELAMADARLPSVDLRVRSSAFGAAAAVAELQREGVQAIIGSPVRSEAAAISAEAERRGLVSLEISAPSSGASTAPGRTFFLLRSNEARAAGLAQHLRTTGLSSVAVLAPATPYGQTMTQAFVTALAGSPVQVTAQLHFAANATTFTAQARQILDLRPQALFVPATATQLELIAAQLAAVGALATYRVEKRDIEPPVKLLLASAEGMGARLLKNAGRYLQGAVLAPIAPGGAALRSGGTAFSGYLEDSGREPGALDALGYDAVQLVRAICAAAGSAGCSAEQIGTGLHQRSMDGATGSIAFDGAGRRSNAPWLLRVDGEGLQPL